MDNKQQEAEQQEAEQKAQAEAQAEQTSAQEQTAQEQEGENAQEGSEGTKEEEVNPLEALRKQYDELKDKYLRQAAEYDNYRKRTIQEKADLLKSAGSKIIVDMLPVIDDFERALTHINDAADVAALKEGVELIYKKFGSFLSKEGVTEIETVGLPLDTNVHEAITMIPAPEPDKAGKIFDCVEKGYKLGDKVIRFAKVVVCQ